MLAKFAGYQERNPDACFDNLPAYAARVARTELVELHRARRTSLGFVSKPGRIDGVAGRINQRLEREPDVGAWLIVLFRIMRLYPFSPHHMHGQWPIEGLRAERVKVLPARATVAMVHRDIAQVMAIARDVAGPRWVFDNLVLPLNSNCPTDQLSDQQPSTSEDTDTAILHRWLRQSYLDARISGKTREAAYRRAVLQVTGCIAPPIEPHILDCLIEMDEELFTHQADHASSLAG